MIYLKTEEEIELLRAANQLVSATLAEIAKVVKPGVTTLELDALAEQFIRDHGAIPTFKGFPASFPDTDPFAPQKRVFTKASKLPSPITG